MNSPNPTPSAAAMAAAKEIFYWPEPNDELTRGEWTAIMAAIIDKHYAAQREAIGAALAELKFARDYIAELTADAQNGFAPEWQALIHIDNAANQLRAVHSGDSTGQAKEDGAS